ncbi:response regulator [Fusobacterium sp.]|uniref:ATP-binding response regulator n=1 Tax=Fusobacterium sp. TaxID=68766 RepID=UPI0025BE861D|nr:response regulator [Fusobacterium sp.]
MKIHKKIAFFNTILFSLNTLLIIYLLKPQENFSIFNNFLYVKIFFTTVIFFLISNFLAKFTLLNIYKTIERFDEIISLVNEKFITELKKEFANMEECLYQVFSSIKIDILDILVKEGEIRKEKEKAQLLSDELQQLNKNLEEIVLQRTKELSISKENAESANRAKDEFLAKISHEMRTPLTPIIGYSRLLLKENVDPNFKEKLDIIHTSGVKLLNFTNELLDFSKIELGKIDLNYESFSVNELFQEIYYEHNALALQKNLKFELEFLQKDKYIYSDKMKIYEIAKNIIHNSIKYTEKGFVLCEIDIKDNYLYFNVYDSGIGIEKENLEYIFESFGQINKLSSGAGLGLSISKKLIEILLGTIQVESKPNVGTTFKIKIPIEVYYKYGENFSAALNKLLNSNNEKLKSIILMSILKFPIRLKKLKDAYKKQDIDLLRETNHLIQGTYGNLNLTLIYETSLKISTELKKENINFNAILYLIEEMEKMTHTLDYSDLFNQYLNFREEKLSLLIAEDVEDNREFLKSILVSENIEVTCVENGLLALKQLQTKKFDAIFLDIRMPVMDGLQTIKYIRDKHLYTNTPILALTAQAIIGDKEKYLPYGFEGYITKPINESVLFSYLYYVVNWKKLLPDEKGELQ